MCGMDAARVVLVVSELRPYREAIAWVIGNPRPAAGVVENGKHSGITAAVTLFVTFGRQWQQRMGNKDRRERD